MVNENIVISLISAISGVLIAYISVKYRNRVNRPQTRDRVDYAFDAYEKLIVSLSKDNDALRREIDTLRTRQ